MTYRFDVLVVGAGPAGIAAAVRAAEEGCKVAIVDENPHPGGQIWRGSPATGTHSKAVASAGEWMGRLSRASVQAFCGWHIFDAPAPKTLRAACDQEAADFHIKSLIIATGARERFLPFPGWTLPNVLGAGGLQALVKAGLPIEGKRCRHCWNRPIADRRGGIYAAERRKCGGTLRTSVPREVAELRDGTDAAARQTGGRNTVWMAGSRYTAADQLLANRDIG